MLSNKVRASAYVIFLKRISLLNISLLIKILLPNNIFLISYYLEFSMKTTLRILSIKTFLIYSGISSYKFISLLLF